METEKEKIQDKFGRELHIGDICFRIKTVSMSNRTRTWVFPVRILDFTKYKVKVGQHTYVNEQNLILASDQGLYIESDG